MLRAGGAEDEAAFVDLWCEAAEARDGAPAGPGVRARAFAKLDSERLAFLVADEDAAPVGFVLVGAPGTGFTTDPPGAAYLSMLAVRPGRWGRGLGRALLLAAEQSAAQVADEAVLHVLAANAAARGLYSTSGWTPSGAPFAHPVSGAPVLTLVRRLPS
ncbi:GNAT family N-acetyltransferase [Rathayibacter sp. ZW T2_19]|uniref:GNAT family N-acetyltransferase n=1 Tax=Rathayibacter rubneri TaxID=2950106 RepID=A0A9X2E3Z3_9MICO|nr:GNAT family N-acetyltransferase [Rathayibacter rubneri]MCM6763879.1 GNAT family N-acetyltransferase [Rathayibacter rubneri]